MSFNIKIKFLREEVEEPRKTHNLKVIEFSIIERIMLYSYITLSDDIKSLTFYGNTLSFLGSLYGNSNALVKRKYKRLVISDDGENFAFKQFLRGKLIVLKEDHHKTYVLSPKDKGIEFEMTFEEVKREVKRNSIDFIRKVLDIAPELYENKAFIENLKFYEELKE